MADAADAPILELASAPAATWRNGGPGHRSPQAPPRSGRQRLLRAIVVAFTCAVPVGALFTVAVRRFVGAMAPRSACPAPRQSAVGAAIDPAVVPWPFMVISLPRKVAVTGIPKVMISSVRSILNREATENGCTQKRCAEARRIPRLMRMANLTEFTRVVVIRDPLERLVSAYFNSDENEFIYAGRCRNTRRCTFEQFVEAIYAGRQVQGKWNTLKNEHFTPQAQIARFARMHYHYVLRMSSPEDLDCFFRNLLGASSKVRVNRSAKGAAEDPFVRLGRLRPLFTNHTVNRILSLYEEDLNVWAVSERPGAAHVPSLADVVPLRRTREATRPVEETPAASN